MFSLAYISTKGLFGVVGTVYCTITRHGQCKVLQEMTLDVFDHLPLYFRFRKTLKIAQDVPKVDILKVNTTFLAPISVIYFKKYICSDFAVVLTGQIDQVGSC